MRLSKIILGDGSDDVSPRIRPVRDFVVFFDWLDKKKLSDCYGVIGGFEVGLMLKHLKVVLTPEIIADINQRKKIIVDGEVYSKDLDLVGPFETAFQMEHRFGPSTPIEVPDRIEAGRRFIYDMRTGNPVDNLHTEIIDGIPNVDLCGDIPQGITSMVNFRELKGCGPVKVPVVDPVTILRNKLHIKDKWGNLRDSDIAHAKLLIMCIPVYLAQAQEQYRKGDMKRNPAIVARRFLNDWPKLQPRIERYGFDSMKSVLSACENCAKGVDRDVFLI